MTYERTIADKYPFSPDQLKLIIESIPANVFFKDTEGRYQVASHVCEMLNSGGQFPIQGKTDLELQPDPVLGKKFYEEDMEIVRSGIQMRYQQEMVFGGISYYYEIAKMPVYEDGTIIGIIGIVQDITETVKLQEQLRVYSETDPLTGTANRFYYNKLLEKGLPFELPIAVIMADCNGLKQINDSLGHHAGDDLLVTTVKNLRNILKDRGTIIRLGGDEFLILIPKCDEQECEDVLRKIRESESGTQIHGFPLSTSYGYAILKKADDSLEAAVHAADSKMYEAKARTKLEAS